MPKKSFRKEKTLNVVLSVLIFLGLILALYYAFVWLGIDPEEAWVDVLVISLAVITPVILYLFGRTWKKEIEGKQN